MILIMLLAIASAQNFLAKLVTFWRSREIPVLVRVTFLA